MLTFKGTHYGEETWLSYTDEDENALVQVMKAMQEKGIAFELLPTEICQNKMFINILKYTSQNDGKPVYCIVCGAKCCYLQTKKLPDDMDIPRLIFDILGQKEGKKPLDIQSKFGNLLTEAMSQSNYIISSGNFSKSEQEVIDLFRKKAESTMTDKEKEVDEWDFEDEDDPVEEKTMFLYMYKVVADILNEKGYDYTDMKRYAEIDHHDVETWESDLERLYDGFYWRSTLRDYMKN